MPQRLAYTKTQRIFHIFWRAAPKHHQKVQIFGDKRPTFSTLTSAKQGPERTSFWTLQRRRETPFSFKKESVRTNKVLAGCPQHQYSHCGLCQPECRRAGKSSDTQFPNMTVSNTIRMMWRPKHALKTAKQPGYATIALTVTQRPPCESMQIPKDNLKPKGLREAKKQTTGASSTTIKH